MNKLESVEELEWNTVSGLINANKKLVEEVKKKSGSSGENESEKEKEKEKAKSKFRFAGSGVRVGSGK